MFLAFAALSLTPRFIQKNIESISRFAPFCPVVTVAKTGVTRARYLRDWGGQMAHRLDRTAQKDSAQPQSAAGLFLSPSRTQYRDGLSVAPLFCPSWAGGSRKMRPAGIATSDVAEVIPALTSETAATPQLRGTGPHIAAQ